MCGGGKQTSYMDPSQALSSRMRQAEQDMIARVNRGVPQRRLLSPQEVALKQFGGTIPRDQYGRPTSEYAKALKEAQSSEQPVYGEIK